MLGMTYSLLFVSPLIAVLCLHALASVPVLSGRSAPVSYTVMLIAEKTIVDFRIISINTHFRFF